MKRVFYVFSVFVLIFVLTACSQLESEPATEGDENVTEKSQTATSTEINYPEKDIELIVPFDPGGGLDNAARILVEKVQKNLPNDVSIVVVNRPGGTGTVGMTTLKNSEPDGYTIAIAPKPTIVLEPQFGEVDYTYEDFQPIIRLVNTAQFMSVKKDSPWNSFNDFFKYVQEHPGEVKIGIIGHTSEGSLAMYKLINETGIDIVLVPYTGGGPASVAVLAGEIDGAIVTGPSFADSDDIKRIFNVNPERSYSYSDIPTIIDSGMDIASAGYTGIFAPKGVPEEVVQILHDAFKSALEDEETVDRLVKVGLDPLYASTEEYEQLIANDWEVEGELLKQLGLIE